MGDPMHLLPLSMAVLLALFSGGTALADPTVTLPEVSHGSNPYRSYVGQFDGAGTETLLAIPAGQDFVITLFYGMSDDLSVYRDDEAILGIPMTAKTYLRTGRARLRVDGGATLSLRREATWSTSKYYLQGYLVQSGGPERFVSAWTPGGGTHTIWTTEAERDFIVRSMAVGSSACDLAVDGTPVTYNSFPFDGVTTGLGLGLGAFVIPAGSSLTLTHSMAGEACAYFMEGAYIQP